MFEENTKYIVSAFVLAMLLIGCGGSGDSNNEIPQELLLGEDYDEKSGDIFTTLFSMTSTISNGRTINSSAVNVKTYSQVESIPSKYNYSNTVSGPYLLETDNEDGEIDGLEYMSMSGDELIDDSLDYFTNIDYTTKNGSNEPENVSIGDEFVYSSNATLFDSQTGEEVGYSIMDMEFRVVNEEEITIPFATFNSVKISYSASQTRSENDIVDTATITGLMWVDVSNGYLLKGTTDGEMSLNEHNLTATFESEVVLQNIYISPDQSRSRASPRSVRGSFIINDSSMNGVVSIVNESIRNISKL